MAMKTMQLKISSKSGSENYDSEGKVTGKSMSTEYRVNVKEDSTDVGSMSISMNTNFYGDLSPEGYEDAMKALQSKIDEAIKTFEQTITT